MSHRVNSTEALPRFLREGGVSDWAPDSWMMTKEGFSGHESKPAQSAVSPNPSILTQEELWGKEHPQSRTKRQLHGTLSLPIFLGDPKPGRGDFQGSTHKSQSRGFQEPLPMNPNLGSGIAGGRGKGGRRGTGPFPQ